MRTEILMEKKQWRWSEGGMGGCNEVERGSGKTERSSVNELQTRGRHARFFHDATLTPDLD